MALNLDFVVLGPVREKAPSLGWSRFAEIARGATLPVYAIGGLPPADLPDAWRAGAHGIAMIRGAWSRIVLLGQAVVLRGPFAEVDQPAALAAERPGFVLGT